jgi:hypothetical protein
MALSATSGHLMRRLTIPRPIHQNAAITATYARSVRAHRQNYTFNAVHRQFQTARCPETDAYGSFPRTRRQHTART